MRKRKEIIIGERFSSLVVIENLNTKSPRKVLVRCDCGVTKEVRFTNLVFGCIQSCGCKRYNKIHGKTNERVYKIYHGIKKRCFNKNHNSYSHYGARGITMCDEWLDKNGFINFYNWSIKNGYSDDLSIDRIDNDKGYSPDNCRWVGYEIQTTNQGIRCDNTSGYKGVQAGKSKTKNNWYSEIFYRKKRVALGSYNTKEEAVKARNDYIIANNLPHAIQEYK